LDYKMRAVTNKIIIDHLLGNIQKPPFANSFLRTVE